MKQFFRLIKIEQKRALMVLPEVFLQALVLLLVLGAAMAVCLTIFKQEGFVRKVSVGIVAEGDDPMTEMALSYLENMESVKTVCDLQRMDRENGEAKLETGEVAGLLVLPENVVDSVLDGSNQPIFFYLPKQADFGTFFMTELVNAGVEMLSIAQAQIYAVHDLAKQNGWEEELLEMEEDMNLSNLHFAVNREQMLKKEKLQVTGTLPLTEHYLTAGIVCILFLSGGVCSRFLKTDTASLKGQLYKNGITPFMRMIAKLFSVLTVGGVIGFALLIFMKIMGYQLLFGSSLSGFLGAVFCMASFSLLCYEVAPGKNLGVMLLSGGSVIMLFLAGGLIPFVFLPDLLKEIGKLLPMQAVFYGETGKPVVFGSIFFMVAFIINKIKEKELL